MNPPHPAIKAMVLCETAIREEATRKASLIGITQKVSARRFPMRIRSLFLYAAFTDASGAYHVRLDILRLEDFAVREGVGYADVVLHDRNSLGELVFDLSGMVLEQPGRYQLTLLTNDRMLGAVSFDVLQSLQQSGGEP